MERDPRGRVITAAYTAMTTMPEAKAADDAAAARWWPLKSLPKLAFDHKKILEAAYEIGKRFAGSSSKVTPAVRRATIKADVRVQKMVLVLGYKILPRRQIVADLGLRQGSRPCFINNYLKPTLNQGYIEFAYPNSPHKPKQAYKLTAKGLDLYDQLTKERG